MEYTQRASPMNHSENKVAQTQQIFIFKRRIQSKIKRCWNISAQIQYSLMSDVQYNMCNVHLNVSVPEPAQLVAYIRMNFPAFRICQCAICGGEHTLAYRKTANLFFFRKNKTQFMRSLAATAQCALHTPHTAQHLFVKKRNSENSSKTWALAHVAHTYIAKQKKKKTKNAQYKTNPRRNRKRSINSKYLAGNLSVDRSSTRRNP